MINKLYHKSLLTLTGLCLSFSHNTFAQPNTVASADERFEHFISLSLEELVNLETSIATASKQTASKAPAVVTLITADDIKATGATNLVEALEGVPGLHIRTSQFGNRPLIQFRGSKGRQTLFMIDGNSMVDLVWNFGIFWKGLPVSSIERIEIIRGPGSALFGADASAGVINVITKTAAKVEYSEAGVRTGSYNTNTAWMQHGTSFNGFDIGITANLSNTDGYNPYIEVDGQTSRDLATGSSASYAPDSAQYGWRSEDIRFSVAKQNWRLNTAYSRATDLQIGLTGFGVLDPVTKADDSRLNIDLLYSNEDFEKNWELDMELRFQHYDYSSGNGFIERPPGYIDANGGLYPAGQINQQESDERRAVFEASTLYTGIDSHAIRIGAGYTVQDLYSIQHRVNYGTGPDGNTLPAGGPIVDISDTAYAFAPENTRKISHIYIQDIWTISAAWELTAGARYDNYSDFGSTFNPRIALVWQSTEKLTSKLLYGQAFRPPSYLELFDETSFTIPNPDLDPERSETLDLVFAYAARKNLQLDMNVFYFKQTDIISRTPTGQFQNAGDHATRGIELEARWQASNTISLYVNYTQRNQDKTTFRAFQESDQDAFLRADWAFKANWNWNLQTSWMGERPRNTLSSNPDLRAPVKAYYVTDTTLRYAPSNNWELAVSVRNLLDSDAREFTGRSIPNDLPLPGRNAYAEARYKF
jgi:outer membrane receptor protein involved in Fe transport